MATFEEWKELLNRKREIYRERQKLAGFAEEFSKSGSFGDGTLGGAIDGFEKTCAYIKNNKVWEGPDQETFLNLLKEIESEVTSAKENYINRLNRWEANLLEEEKNMIIRIQDCQNNMDSKNKALMYEYELLHGSQVN